MIDLTHLTQIPFLTFTYHFKLDEKGQMIEGEYGDFDIVLIINCILSNDCDGCSDWNYDGSVDILDIILMINIILEP